MLSSARDWIGGTSVIEKAWLALLALTSGIRMLSSATNCSKCFGNLKPLGYVFQKEDNGAGGVLTHSFPR